MKKLMIASMALLVSATLALALIDPTSTGTVVGNGYIGAYSSNCIAIGGGTGSGTNETGLAYVGPHLKNAIQIGNGSNMVSDTISVGALGYITTTSSIPWSAANIVAGSTITAINGAAITNLNGANVQAGTVVNAGLASGISAAKLLAGSTVTAVNGASVTNLNLESNTEGKTFSFVTLTNYVQVIGGVTTTSNVNVVRW